MPHVEQTSQHSVLYAAGILHAVQVQIAIYDITRLCCSTSQDPGTLSYSGVYIPMEHLTSMLYMVAALSSKGKSGLQQNGYGINALDAESFVRRNVGSCRNAGSCW